MKEQGQMFTLISAVVDTLVTAAPREVWDPKTNRRVRRELNDYLNSVVLPGVSGAFPNEDPRERMILTLCAFLGPRGDGPPPTILEEVKQLLEAGREGPRPRDLELVLAYGAGFLRATGNPEPWGSRWPRALQELTWCSEIFVRQGFKLLRAHVRNFTEPTPQDDELLSVATLTMLEFIEPLERVRAQRAAAETERAAEAARDRVRFEESAAKAIEQAEEAGGQSQAKSGALNRKLRKRGQDVGGSASRKPDPGSHDLGVLPQAARDRNLHSWEWARSSLYFWLQRATLGDLAGGRLVAGAFRDSLLFPVLHATGSIDVGELAFQRCPDHQASRPTEYDGSACPKCSGALLVYPQKLIFVPGVYGARDFRLCDDCSGYFDSKADVCPYTAHTKLSKRRTRLFVRAPFAVDPDSRR